MMFMLAVSNLVAVRTGEGFPHLPRNWGQATEDFPVSYLLRNDKKY